MSPLKLDHVFIITDSPASAAQRFIDLGLIEGTSNTHPGQGTANRRFFLNRFTIELLYISDAEEASHGAGQRLGILERSNDPSASPFGLVARVQDPGVPPTFPAWHYQPDYFPQGMFFHVADNSRLLVEPLCICMPPALPEMKDVPAEFANPQWQLTSLELAVPAQSSSAVLTGFLGSCRISDVVADPSAEQGVAAVVHGRVHHLRMQFNGGRAGKQVSLLPALPVSVAW